MGLTLRSLAVLLAACVSAGAQFTAQVTDTGAVNVDVGGARCLDTFQIILPAPDWKGGATPRDGKREEVGPGHVRVTGIMADPQPCARFTVDSQERGGGLDLAWELTFTRDFEAETVRLNGYLPVKDAAGKAAWFVARPRALKWALFPAAYGDPGGNLSDWGFDWFGWLLPGDHGIRFRPQSGFTDMYLQDGRQWNGDVFQTCWTLLGKGTIRQGTVLRCAVRLEPLIGADVVKVADPLGAPLFAATADLQPRPDGGVQGHVEVRTVRPAGQALDIEWRINDDLGAVLAQGTGHVGTAGMGAGSLDVTAPASPSGEYRLHAAVKAPGGKQVIEVDRRLVAQPPGPRSSVSLDGAWQLIAAERDLDAPPEGAWQPTTVPGRIGDAPHHHWFRRQFEVPAAMAGKRLGLHFGAVNHEARVYVNGRLAGKHFGADLPFEIDVTDLVHPGANDLSVAVTDWTAACTNPPAVFEVKQFEHPGWKVPANTIIAPIGGDFRLTGIWQSVSLVAEDPVHVADLFVRTSVRQHVIQVTATVRNESDRPRTVAVANAIADRAGPVKTLPATSVSVAPGESKEVVVKADWPNAHLWSLDDPHLYRLTTTLTEGGQALDSLPTRFGFREVWCDGPRFVLNGVPMKLFATSGWGMDTYEAARDHLARMKRAGTRSMRLHTQPWQPYILDAADELGMLIVDEAAVYCYQQDYAIGDERFWSNYADHVRALARRDRNHPSLAIYSLENEILSCGADPKVWEPHLGELADTMRGVDPTRLIMCESDLDPAGKMDLIGMHYPREYWSGFTLYPDKCWWMDQPIPYIGRQWQWKRDKPLYIGEFDGGFPAWYPQYQAFWLGDEAYTSKGRFSVESPNSRARQEMIRAEVMAYRAYGVTGLNPWFDPDEVDVFGPTAYAPLALSIREWTHDFYAGESITRTVTLYNDSFRPARLNLTWSTSPAARVAAQPVAQLPVELQPCTSATRTITFRAPEVTSRETLTLSLTLTADGRQVATESQRLSIFPRVSAEAAHPLAGCLYDPLGKTAPALKRLGLAAQPLPQLDAVPAGAKAVIIGAGALKAGEAPWAVKLAEFAAGGGTVLCLEQTAYPSNWLPVPAEIDAKHATTIAFLRAPRHPALAHLAGDDLRFWRPDDLVARGSLLKPTRGNFRPLIDAGGIRSAIDEMNGLNWTPLLELPYGRGRYLLCQLPLVERVGVEPVADLLLHDLAQYAATAAPNDLTRVALVADPESTLKRAFDGLGVVYDSLLASLSRESLADRRVLVAGGRPAAWNALRAQAPAVADWVKQGGALWLNNVTPSEADLLASLGAPCALTSADVVPVSLSRPDPLTSGLSNHELYWRDRPIWDQWTALRRIIDFQPADLPPGAVALTDPPGLVKVPIGKGVILINQLLWDSTERNRLDGTKIASILLTNLGAQMDLSPFTPVRPEAFVPVDLARYCNLGFAGDPDKGWMDHGPKALAGFPTGDQTMARARFRIVNPAENGGKSVIALRGAARPGYPAGVKGIPVDAPFRALHFLHTCAWGQPDGADAATYIVHYADGTEQRLPIRIGVEVADWYVDPHALPSAEVAWSGNLADKPGPIGAYAFRWVNPYPDRPISSIDLLSANGNPVVAVMAISGEK